MVMGWGKGKRQETTDEPANRTDDTAVKRDIIGSNLDAGAETGKDERPGHPAHILFDDGLVVAGTEVHKGGIIKPRLPCDAAGRFFRPGEPQLGGGSGCRLAGGACC